MKTLLQSKTFWLAVAQAVGGVLVVAFTQLDMMGAVLVTKSVVDIILRIYTDQPVGSIF